MSKPRILTPQEEQQLLAFRDEWLQIGLSTEPADRSRAEESIRALYALNGKVDARSTNTWPRPDVLWAAPEFVWCDSPAQVPGVHAGIASVSRGAGIGAYSVHPSIYNRIKQPKIHQLLEILTANISDQLRESVGVSLRSVIEEAIGNSLGVAVAATLGSVMGGAIGTGKGADTYALIHHHRNGVSGARDNLHNDLIRLIGDVFRGHCEAAWIAEYVFYESILGVRFPVESNEQLAIWTQLARSCGWWWPYQGVCVVCERPKLINLDDRRRLHNRSGPAVQFRDGSSVYAIEGVLVDPYVVENPEQICTWDIRGEQNEEVKRIKIEQYGPGKYLMEIGAKPIDVDSDEAGIDRSLMRTEDGQQYLVCACPSTSRVYHLKVSPEVETCVEAARFLMADERMRIVAQS